MVIVFEHNFHKEKETESLTNDIVYLKPLASYSNKAPQVLTFPR